ncbi:Fe-S cluster assembly ATPase SufC [Paenibacillus medicaginis]|uniref:Fe-S cluster assembly ATPase SufC n=1 Tax=Paenibacillus medicaginis TaxID=1470560 RepID=A0ABV5C2J7_9BACL
MKRSGDEMTVSLRIHQLKAAVEGKEILKGLSLAVNGGEIHVVMGPNGTGKSTLASALMGHPKYEVTEGVVTLNGEDLLEMDVDERARAGLFLAMQYPSEIAGVTNADFMRSAINARREEGQEISLMKFVWMMEASMQTLEMNPEFMHRYLNEGFSGGEKKRNEILQMMMLQPSMVILDEIDSGLDIDALRIVAEGVNALRSADRGFLIITHYQRLLNYIKPDFVHVMMQGTIVKSGGPELAERLEADGYEWIKEELGITEEAVILEEEESFQIPMKTKAPRS